MTFGMCENETEIDFMMTKKEHRRFVQNVNAITGEFHRALLIADVDKKNKKCSEKDMF